MTMMRQDQMAVLHFRLSSLTRRSGLAPSAQVPQIRPQPSLARDHLLWRTFLLTPRGITTPVGGVEKGRENVRPHATFTAARPRWDNYPITTVLPFGGIKKGGCGFNQDQSCETPATLKRSWQPCPARASAQLA